MSTERLDVRSIAWREVFPFVRLFSTFENALSYSQLLLGLLAVSGVYVVGRGMDALWVSSGGGALVAGADESMTEVHAYAMQGHAFEEWKREAERSSRERIDRGREAEKGDNLRTASNETLRWVAARLDDGKRKLNENQNLKSHDKREQSEALERAADVLRYHLNGLEPKGFAPAEVAGAPRLLIESNPDVKPADRAAEMEKLAKLMERNAAVRAAHHAVGAGPFDALLKFEMSCFAAAVHGVAAGRWGMSGGAFEGEPSLFGSLRTATAGLGWFVTQRPIYASVFGFALLVILGMFGTAICRIAALRITREENGATGKAIHFVWERFGGVLGGPALPIAVFVGVFVLMWLGGLIGGLVPVLGPLLTAVLGVLYLLGGLALAFCALSLLFGFHIFWPTIAVEGSDSFDAFQRGAYVLWRPGSFAFFWLVAMVVGGLGFLLVRLAATLMLKLTHCALGAGMSLWSSSGTSTIGQLDAMWRMPAWNEITILPSVTGAPFWGEFATAPLSGAECVSAFVLAAWVFIVVGLVGAFVISHYFTSATQIYLLLRQQIDGVDFDEIFYEDELDDLDVSPASPAGPAGDGGSKGMSLPVVK